MKLNRKGVTMVETLIVVIITSFIIMSVYTISASAYAKYNQFKIQNFVMEENSKFLKALSGIRFGQGVSYLDQNPVNHPNLSSLIVSFPNEQTVEFKPDDLGVDDTNDITFFNVDKDEIYTYNKDIIDIKKFEIIELDDTVHRGGLRFHIILGASSKNNPEAARMFGGKEYFLDYNITYTFRNKEVIE